MEDPAQFLPLFIDEEIYLIPEKSKSQFQENMEIKAPEVIKSEKPAAPEQKVQITGKEPGKEVVVLLNQPLNRNEAEFLQKVLGAVQLKLQDYEIIAGNEAVQSGLADELLSRNCKTILAFGLKNKPAGLDVESQSITEWSGLKVLDSPQLSQIAGDVVLKRKLWSNLKLLFDV